MWLPVHDQREHQGLVLLRRYVPLTLPLAPALTLPLTPPLTLPLILTVTLPLPLPLPRRLGTCVAGKHVCDGTSDCAGHEDELGCGFGLP